MSPPSDEGSARLGERSENQYERLQRKLDNYSDDDIIEREEPGETLADWHTEEYYKLSEEDANDLLSFFITTSAIIERESILMINVDVFNFGLKGGNSIEFLEENLTQKDREDMLFCLGLIDSGLKGELARVRKRRNELAHHHQHDEVEDIQQLKNDIKRAKNAKDELSSIGTKVEMEAVGHSPESGED